MKKIICPALLVLPAIMLSFCTSSSGEKANNQKVVMQAKRLNATNNIAVLELFTSQGCSSCPPADRLLGSYAARQNVIILSYHVDYWDHLGWKDPYSSRAYTQRQYEYTSALHADVYTPQLFINGETEMVGSDSNKIENTINRLFDTPATATLSITKTENKDGKVIVNYTTSGNTSNDVLNIALTEKNITTKVKAGENGGSTLTGYNVVISLKTFGVPKGEGVQEIAIPSSIGDLKNISVVAFMQDKSTHKISGAAEASCN